LLISRWIYWERVLRRGSGVDPLCRIRSGLLSFFLPKNSVLLREYTGTDIPEKQRKYIGVLGKDGGRCRQRIVKAHRRHHRSGELSKASSRKSFKKGASKALRAEGQAVVFKVVAGEPPRELSSLASLYARRRPPPKQHLTSLASAQEETPRPENGIPKMRRWRRRHAA
jgi:hypothetical protein